MEVTSTEEENVSERVECYLKWKSIVGRDYVSVRRRTPAHRKNDYFTQAMDHLEHKVHQSL